MSDMTSDPVRLLTDPTSGAQLQADLGAAAEAQVHGIDFASGLASLKTAIAAQTGAVAPVAAAGLSATFKVAVAGAVVVGGAALWLGLSPPAPRVSASPAIAAGAPLHPAPPVAEADALGTAKAPVAAPVPLPPSVAAPAVSPPITVPAAPPTVAELPLVPDEEVAPDAAPKARRAKAKRPALSVQEAMAEADIIARAKRALATSPTEALALADEAQRTYRKGMLVQEREAIAIQALARLGRADQANQRAESFLKRYGRGPHAAAVRSALQGL